VARGQTTQAPEQVGDGAAACGEDGGQRQQDDPAISGPGQGRFQRLEDGVDRLGELAADPLELSAAEAGLSGLLAALFPREPPLLAPTGAGLWGLLAVVSTDSFWARPRSQPLAGSLS
jgi:hypothetical protein